MHGGILLSASVDHTLRTWNISVTLPLILTNNKRMENASQFLNLEVSLRI
jgi:WD40 repeat protein